MKPTNIEAGGIYAGDRGVDRLVKVVFRNHDPKRATVKYYRSDGVGGFDDAPRYCSARSFARWAKRRVKRHSKKDRV